MATGHTETRAMSNRRRRSVEAFVLETEAMLVDVPIGRGDDLPIVLFDWLFSME